MPLLYEVNTRAWLRELSERTGKPVQLGDVPESEINRWDALGFTDIWLMGAWEIGAAARELALEQWRKEWRKEIPSEEGDVIGSPYGISFHTIDEALGGRLGMLGFKRKLNSLGLALTLDFVPNHLSADTPALDQFPAYFVQANSPREGTFVRKTKFGKRYFAHGRDPYFPPWKDTVQIEHRNLQAQRMLMRIAETMSLFCDGFRCDLAMLVLHDIVAKTWQHLPVQVSEPPTKRFWPELMANVRARAPHFEFIAEVYWGLEKRLQEEGFDYTYSKPVYDHLIRGDHPELQKFLLSHSPEFLARSVHFLENHDEPRVASLLPLARHKAAVALLLTMPGMILLHDGQLEGRKAFARIQMSKRLPEERDAVVAEFYETLLLTLRNTLVRVGDSVMLEPFPAEPGNGAFEQFFVSLWQGKEDFDDLAIVNMSDQPGRCLLHEALPYPEQNVPVLYTTDAQAAPALQFHSGRIRVELPALTAQVVRLKKNRAETAFPPPWLPKSATEFH